MAYFTERSNARDQLIKDMRMLLIVIACLAGDVKGRFLDIYPSESNILKKEFIEVRGVATLRDIDRGKVGRPGIIRFATGPGRRKFEFEIERKQKSGEVISARSGYCELDGRIVAVRAMGKADPYTIRTIGDDDPMSRARFDAVFGDYLQIPWRFVAIDIGEALRRGWIVISEAKEIDEGGRTLVEVAFRQAKTDRDEAFRVAFDPSVHWAIARAARYLKDPAHPVERYEATYGPTASGKFYLKEVHRWRDGEPETLCAFESVEFAPTPASEFTLEHYGLKSPPLPDRGRSSRRVWAVVGLAVVLLIGGWSARRLAARGA